MRAAPTPPSCAGQTRAVRPPLAGWAAPGGPGSPTRAAWAPPPAPPRRRRPLAFFFLSISNERLGEAQRGGGLLVLLVKLPRGATLVRVERRREVAAERALPLPAGAGGGHARRRRAPLQRRLRRRVGRRPPHRRRRRAPRRRRRRRRLRRVAAQLLGRGGALRRRDRARRVVGRHLDAEARRRGGRAAAGARVLGGVATATPSLELAAVAAASATPAPRPRPAAAPGAPPAQIDERKRGEADDYPDDEAYNRDG